MIEETRVVFPKTVHISWSASRNLARDNCDVLTSPRYTIEVQNRVRRDGMIRPRGILRFLEHPATSIEPFSFPSRNLLVKVVFWGAKFLFDQRHSRSMLLSPFIVNSPYLILVKIINSLSNEVDMVKRRRELFALEQLSPTLETLQDGTESTVECFPRCMKKIFEFYAESQHRKFIVWFTITQLDRPKTFRASA